MPISDKSYRLLLSSGITAGGLGLTWILMKAITPSKEEMLKVRFCVKMRLHLAVDMLIDIQRCHLHFNHKNKQHAHPL